MPRRASIAALLVIAASTLAACGPEDEVGYVEIRKTSLANLDDVYLLNTTPVRDLSRKGFAVLRQTVGPTTLGLRRGGHVFPLCEFRVQKNRLVTITLSGVDGKLKCAVQA
jgi:hypothetical protein